MTSRRRSGFGGMPAVLAAPGCFLILVLLGASAL